MGKIICISNIKGGTGKSSTAINLAGYLSNAGEVLLIDADPQGTISDWYEVRQKNKIENETLAVSGAPYSGAQLKANIESDAGIVDYLIIDTPPEDARIMRTALIVADYLIVPITPSPFDIRSAGKTVDAINEGIESGAISIKPRLLISKAIVGTVLATEARKALSVFGIEVFKNQICQRIAYAEAGIAGQTIQEYEPASAAAVEFNQFGKETLEWLKNS